MVAFDHTPGAQRRWERRDAESAEALARSGAAVALYSEWPQSRGSGTAGGSRLGHSSSSSRLVLSRQDALASSGGRLQLTELIESMGQES